MIKTVVFDIGGVLTELGRMKFLEQFGYSEEINRRIVAATMASDDWKEYDRGVLTQQEMMNRFVENDPEIEEPIRHCMKNVHGIVRHKDEAIPWIRSVKARGRKALFLSNYSMKVRTEAADATDFLPELDGGVWSYEEHLIKPDRWIYECLLERYDLKPEETVFIDDNEPNLVQPRLLGMRTIHYLNQEQAQSELDRMLEEA